MTTLKDEGNAFYKRGEFAAALSKYLAARQVEPLSPIFPFNAAAAALELGRYEEAVAYATEARDKSGDAEYRAKCEARLEKAQRLSAQTLVARAAPLDGEALVAPCAMGAWYDYMCVGTETSFSLATLQLTAIERSRAAPRVSCLPDKELVRVLQAGGELKLLFAACSDPRHVLETVCDLSQRVGLMQAKATGEDARGATQRGFIVKDPVEIPPNLVIKNGPLRVTLVVNDILPECTARAVLLIVLARAVGFVRSGVAESEQALREAFGENLQIWPEFFDSLLFMVWLAFNLEPLQHRAYVSCLRFLRSEESWKKPNVLLAGLAVGKSMQPHWNAVFDGWLRNAELVTVESVSRRVAVAGSVPMSAAGQHLMDRLDEKEKALKQRQEEMGPQEDEMLTQTVEMLRQSPDTFAKLLNGLQEPGDPLEDKEAMVRVIAARCLENAKGGAEGSMSKEGKRKWMRKHWSKHLAYNERYPGCLIPYAVAHEGFPDPYKGHKLNSSMLPLDPTFGGCFEEASTHAEDLTCFQFPVLTPKLEPTSAFMLLAAGWCVFGVCLPSWLSVEYAFECDNMLSLPQRSLSAQSFDRIHCSNVPDYVSVLNTVVALDSIANDGCVMCSDILAAIPLFMRHEEETGKNLVEAYFYSCGRLTHASLSAFGWTLYIAEDMTFFLRRDAKLSLSASEWRRFLDDLLLFFCFPVIRPLDARMTPSVTLGSVYAAIQRARLPLHWSEQFLDSLSGGSLSTAVDAPRALVESPGRVAGHKTSLYDLIWLQTEAKMLDFRGLRLAVVTFVCTRDCVVTSIAEPDLRCVLFVSPKDESAFERQLKRSFDAAVKACAHPIHVLSSNLSAKYGSGRVRLSFSIPLSIAETLRDGRVCYCMPSFGTIFVGEAFSSFRPQSEVEK
jgi:tetratricopeptide (TPR) repeat protein